ncbi:MAG: chaperone modulator CbpM [Roseovarius sp.]|nr:chaperone modulator CbpM [Roseovarius sp.]
MSIDEQTVVARVERVTTRELRLWVRQGWVRPAESAAGPVFDELDIARIRLLCDLKKEMSLSTDTIPVVLTLIDRLHQTRRDLRALTKALEAQPEEVRRSVVAKFQDIQNKANDIDDEQ